MGFNEHPPPFPDVHVSLTAAELLEIAAWLEKTGIEFYRLLSEEVEDGPLRNFLLGLLGMETRHENMVRSLRDELAEEERIKCPFDEGLTGREYFVQLRSLISHKLFPVNESIFQILDRAKKPEDILPLGLEMEQRAIVIYQRFAGFDLSPQGRRVVETLLEDERNHFHEIEKIYRRTRF